MSAIAQLAKYTAIIVEATAMIAKMQESLPALIAAASAVPIAAASAVPIATASAVPILASKAKKAKKDASKPKKPASEGTMAWHAFVSHIQTIQPSRFAELKKRSDVLHEAKAIREEDEAGYKGFIANWKKERLATLEPAIIASEVVVYVAPVSELVPIVTVEPKEKRKASIGTMAWFAFIKHCKDTMPQIATIAKPSEKMQAIKLVKESDSTAYIAFVTEWKASHAQSMV
jgi:hypothetical protein